MSEHEPDELGGIVSKAAEAIGGRVATPEEMQVITDRAVTHVMAEEELILSTPLALTVEGRPPVPKGEDLAHILDLMKRQILEMVSDVSDPAIAYGPNRDGYGKCVEVMWRAAYLAMEVVASELGVTGFQHSMATLQAFKEMRRIEGPFMIVTLDDAVYPQYDIPGRVDEFIQEQRPWLAEKAKALLADKDRCHVAPAVLAHWEKLAAYVPEASR